MAPRQRRVGITDVAGTRGSRSGPSRTCSTTRRRSRTPPGRGSSGRSRSSATCAANPRVNCGSGGVAPSGLVVLDMRNPFFTDVARGAQDAATEAGLQVIICNTDEHADAGGGAPDGARRARRDGRARHPVGHRHRRATRCCVDTRSRSCSSTAPSTNRSPAPSASTTWPAPRRRSVTSSLSGTAGSRWSSAPHGCRRFADRVNGARARRRRRRTSRRHASSSLECPTLTFADGLDAAQRRARIDVLDRPRSSVPTTWSRSASSRCMTQHGVSVPDEMSLVGYDDIEFAAAAAVPLTSVRQPSTRIGQVALELLLAEIKDRGRRRGPRAPSRRLHSRARRPRIQWAAASLTHCDPAFSC